MLTGHFYDSNSTRKFESFLKSVKNLIIVCDPPFGIMVEALFRTIRQLKDKFVDVHQKESYRINLILVMPLFVGKHVKECDDSMEMVDYKICYVNHSKYAKPQKSIVRFFTGLPLKQFVLPAESGYRFCEMCERYVANENRHCGLCGICPSKDQFLLSNKYSGGFFRMERHIGIVHDVIAV
ncbi:unnamed protein product [Anisakis simplex]|uniref:N6_N4_Mtase domain-containing protein n=1 Tax=Anisakis simplex TaxID=6269 RepID=A0A0M3KHJ8_ANISI|nr:unnamed protein product [Anisakis simplex]